MKGVFIINKDDSCIFLKVNILIPFQRMSGSSEDISHEELSYVDGAPTYTIVVKDLMTKMRKWNYNQRISSKPLTVNGVNIANFIY